MWIRQLINIGLIWVLLAGVVAGLEGGGVLAQQTPTDQLRVLSESLKATDLSEIRELIQAGADVNVKNKTGITPLYMAARNGHDEIVTALLEAGANVNAATTNGETPLWGQATVPVGKIHITHVLLRFY